MLLCAGMAWGQQRSIVAGLEENTEYRALIAEEADAARMADSISQRISELRRTFRTDSPDSPDRAANSAAILRMEEESFELRGRMARLASQINAIEQEWFLENPYAADGDGKNTTEADKSGDAVPEKLPANLVLSPFFERNLSPEQLRELRDADRAEAELPGLLAQYLENHARLKFLADDYGRATTQAAADSIGTQFQILSVENRLLDEQIGELWETIFDSKSYVYNLLAEKLGYRDLSNAWPTSLEQMREQRLELQDRPRPITSEAIADYLIQKPFLVSLETGFAEIIANRAALDSLKRASSTFYRLGMLDDLESVRLRERFFLDYADIKIGASPYNVRNPIPEVTVWPRGVIYRVLLGNFSAPQALPIFRDASPLAVQKSEEGRWRYFAGGFTSDSTAQKAIERLRKAGFRNPSVVVWMDGVYIDPAAGNEKAYSVELSGVEELSPEVREAIGGNDIVQGESRFIVSPLDAQAAMHLRTVLGNMESRHPDMTVKLSKIVR